MRLTCDVGIADFYKSPSQRARIISESWFATNGYCLACDADSLVRTTPNTIATDFSCAVCGHGYELKTFRRRPQKSLVDGAYGTLMSQIEAGLTPTLCLLERNDIWRVISLVAIHASLLTPWAVEPRPPLREGARRTGWIGCNIRVDRIPPDAKISLIEGGVVHSKLDVRRKFRKYIPLSNLSAEQRGWTAMTLRIARGLGKPNFSLRHLYQREVEFAKAYPNNRHVREKIRQQLQVLRDLGVLTFKGDGKYSFID